MPHADVYTRTAKGTLELRNRASALPPELQPVLNSIDGRATLTELSVRLRLGHRNVQQAVQQLETGGYIEPAEAADDGDGELDFTSPDVMSKLQAEAKARARAEAAAQARAEQAQRDAAAAALRQQEQTRAQAEAQANAARAAQAREQAAAAARAADAERVKAEEQASTAWSVESRAAAQARIQAALLAEARAAAQARESEAAESAARDAVTQTQNTAARAGEEAQAHARAGSEAQARAHAEAHARAMVEAQLKAMSAALARAQALAREEADARARLTADLQAREAAEAQVRADGAARARADAEAYMRTELSKLRQEAQHALEAADARAEAERQAREAAEALAERERSARAAAEARAAADLEAQRRAHAAARAATQARVEEERAAREAAESRAQAELQARLAHESAVHASAENRVRERVAEEISAREEAERAADAQYRAEAARRAQLAAAVPAPAQPRFEWRRKRLDHALLAKAGAGAALVLAVGAALLLPVVPLDGYVLRVEKAAGGVLHQPVRIGRMEYRVFPAPELVLERVTIGASYSSRVERISVSAWPWELSGGDLRFDSVAVSGAVLEQDGMAALHALLDAGSGGMQVERAVFNGARVAIQDVEFPISSAAMRFQRNGGIHSISATSGSATLEAVRADGGTWQIAVNARNWQPPLGPALKFESLAVKGVIEGRRLSNASVRAHIAGGELTGIITADWRDGVRAEGGFQVTKAKLHSLLPAYTPHFTAQGLLSAEGRYLFQAASLGKLLQDPRVTADFRVASGELVNVDIVRALQQVSAKAVQGGLTRFEQLAGRLEVTGDRYRYRELKLASGPMSAAGNVEIAPGNRLAGLVTADVHAASRTAIRGRLTVSGTLTNPVLRP